MKKIFRLFSIVSLLLVVSIAFTQDVKKEEKKDVKAEVKTDAKTEAKTEVASPSGDLAKESEEKCISTEKDPITFKELKAKVAEAAALIEKEGEKAFPKFRGKDSPYIFSGTYMTIRSLDKGIMLVHPLKPKLEGTDMNGFKDASGKFYGAEIQKGAQEKGEGWVEYMWPKPGEKKSSPKLAYYKAVKSGGKGYVLVCGLNDKTLADVKKELGE